MNSTELYEDQIKTEQAALAYGFQIKSDGIHYGIERAKITGDICGLGQGSVIAFNLYEQISTELFDIIKNSKGRPAAWYQHLIMPTLERYNTDLEYAQKYNRACTYEHPVELLSVLITRELCKLLVCDIETKMTQFGRNIVDRFFPAYNLFGDIKSEALSGITQLIRTILPNQVMFEESRISTTITIKLSNECYKINHDELMGFINNPKTVFKPMVSEPVDHTNLLDGDGGYYLIHSPLLRHPEKTEVRDYNFVNQEFFDTINRIQKTQFCINKRLYTWLKACTSTHVSQYFNIDLGRSVDASNARVKAMTERVRELDHKIRLTRNDTWERKQNNTISTEENKEIFKNVIVVLKDEMESLEKQIQEENSKIGKLRGYVGTTRDAEIYMQYDYFYHPVFLDNRARIYTANTSLSPQGSKLAKSLVSTFKTERLTEEGITELKVLLGGMFNGYSKKNRNTRINFIDSIWDDIVKTVKHADYSLFESIDEDELLSAIDIMTTLVWTSEEPTFETGMLGYIDSTSSAIQIQALIQKCKTAARLTNLLPNDTEELPDAYGEVAKVCHSIVKTIPSMSDSDLIKTMRAVYDSMGRDSTVIDLVVKRKKIIE